MKYLIALAVVCLPAVAAANPKKLPYSYGTQTMHEGGFELEQYVEIIPLRVLRENEDGTQDGVWATRYLLTTELEYGLTDRVELGLYFAWHQGASATAPFLAFDGIKQRARIRVSEPDWPIGVATYLELAEKPDEFELEEKVLLSWRSGAIEAVANLWVEQEYYFADDDWKFLYNPTLGATYEVSPRAAVGLEYWARGNFDADSATAHYLGPTVMLQGGEHWVAFGAYARLASDIEIGDPYGRIWVRVIAGIGL